jgi:hypothetical protein
MRSARRGAFPPRLRRPSYRMCSWPALHPFRRPSRICGNLIHVVASYVMVCSRGLDIDIKCCSAIRWTQNVIGREERMSPPPKLKEVRYSATRQAKQATRPERPRIGDGGDGQRTRQCHAATFGRIWGGNSYAPRSLSLIGSVRLSHIPANRSMSARRSTPETRSPSPRPGPYRYRGQCCLHRPLPSSG